MSTSPAPALAMPTSPAPSLLALTLAAPPLAESNLITRAQILSAAQPIRISRPSLPCVREGVERLVPTLVSLARLITELFRRGKPILSGLSAMLMPPALAEPQKVASEQFVPPLGLTQPLFDVIIFIFVFVMFVVIVAMVYAGYFAKKKNEAAASLVERVTTFLLGIIFGKLSPL
jgi:hypothetical protein